MKRIKLFVLLVAIFSGAFGMMGILNWVTFGCIVTLAAAGVYGTEIQRHESPVKKSEKKDHGFTSELYRNEPDRETIARLKPNKK